MRKPPKTRHTVQPMSQPNPCVASSTQPERIIAIGSARKVFETKPPKVASDQPATKTTKNAMPSARRADAATGVSGFTCHGPSKEERPAGLLPLDAQFAQGRISAGTRSFTLAEVVGRNGLSAEDAIDFGDLAKTYAQATFGAHFAEVAVDAATGEVRVRRMGGVFAAGRILNPKTARSQVIGAMTMGLGAALMEEAVVDTRHGCFVNHDLAEYHVPVHADVPMQEVIFLDEVDEKSSPMKAKGVAELGLCGCAAAVANAVYNATGVRVRDYPITLDKIILGLM